MSQLLFLVPSFAFKCQDVKIFVRSNVAQDFLSALLAQLF